MSVGFSRDRWTEYIRKKVAKGDYSAIVITQENDVWAENRYGKTIADGEAGVDDTKVIQKALDSLTPNRTWKEKVVLKGSFEIKTTIEIPSYTVLDLTQAKLKLVQDGIDLIYSKGLDTSKVDDSPAIEYVDIIGGTIDGNRSNLTSAASLIVLKAKHSKVINVTLKEVEGVAIYFLQSEDCKALFNTVDGCNHGAIVFDRGCKKCLAFRNTVMNTYGEELAGPGIYVANEDQAKPNYSIEIIANTIVNAGQSAIHLGYDSYYCKVFVNTVDSPTDHGVRIDQGLGCIISKNHFLNIPNYKNAVRVEGDSRDIDIARNYCHSDGPGATGIYLVSTVDYINIIRNNLRNWAGTKISIESGGNPNGKIKGNIGYTTENSGTATFSGDGSTTQFKIAHGLVSTPSKVLVTPMSEDASGDFYVTADNTYIYINYKTAPPSGTDNVKVSWYAEI